MAMNTLFFIVNFFCKIVRDLLKNEHNYVDSVAAEKY